MLLSRSARLWQSRVQQVVEMSIVSSAVLTNYQERIIALESEVKRLKSRLAAEARDEDLMKFIFAHEGNATSSDYINTLKNRAS